MMKDIAVPTSPGELIDKLTILRIKSERMQDAAKLANVRHEQAVLRAIAAAHVPGSAALAELTEALYRVNGRLWTIEDEIREHEAAADFGPRFVELARAVYMQNDDRARIKKDINLLLGSALVEEKSYADYRRE